VWCVRGRKERDTKTLLLFFSDPVGARALSIPSQKQLHPSSLGAHAFSNTPSHPLYRIPFSTRW
jgi:hypothetical protein